MYYEVAAFGLTNATLTTLGNGPVDNYPGVSPDGNVVAWRSCPDDTSQQCDVTHSVRDANGWNITPLTSGGNNQDVATDGAIVAYSSIRNGEYDVYWQPVGGGAEMQLALPDIQWQPSVFDGVIVFESRSNGNFDIFAYDTITSTLYELTTNPSADFLSDVDVVGDTATVVYTVFNGTDNDVRAISFDLNRPGSVEQQLLDLRAAISASGNVLTKALDAKLRTAESALAVGDTSAACTALQDFINHVTAQRGKKIAVADADAWIGAAQQLRSAIGCS